MKTRALAFLVAAIVCFALACNGSKGPGPGPNFGPTGTANPPFEGNPPDEPYLFEGTPGTYGGVMVMALESNPKSFNPLTSNETSTTDITNGVLTVPLFGYDNIAQKTTPGVATYEVSPDGLVITAHIRKGVRWSDGEPFNADDVKFNFDVLLDPKVPNPGKDLLAQSDGSFPTVEKLDDYTIKFTFTEVNALAVDNIGSIYLIPKHKWESAYKGGTFLNVLGLDTKPEDIVGLGPYRLKEFAQDQRIVLERNPYYWKVDTKGQRLPYIDRVICVIVPDINTSMLQFNSGQTDMIRSIPVSSVEKLKADEAVRDYKIYDLGGGFNTIYIMFNQNTGKDAGGAPLLDPAKSSWFTNTKFRQAISYAIDRDGICKTAFLNLAAPIYSFVAPANKQWFIDGAITKYTYNPEKAKSLLKEIGIEDRNGDGTLEDAKGKPIQFTLEVNNNNQARVDAGTFIKSNLEKVGIKVDLKPIPFNDLIAKLKETYKWEAVIGGWQTGVPPDPQEFKNVLLSSGDSHYWFPQQKSPATDWERRINKLVKENGETFDMAKRLAAYEEITRIWSEQLPEIDLLVQKFFVGAKNRFGNFNPSPMPLYTYWNIEEIYLTK